jgi:hypothetical protein
MRLRATVYELPPKKQNMTFNFQLNTTFVISVFFEKMVALTFVHPLNISLCAQNFMVPRTTRACAHHSFATAQPTSFP